MEGKHLYLAAREAFFQPSHTALSIPKTIVAAMGEAGHESPLADYYIDRNLMELDTFNPYTIIPNMDDYDPDKLYCRAQLAPYAFKREALMNKAARKGHPQAMGVLINEYAETLSAIEYAVYSARYVLLAGDVAFTPPPDRAPFKTAQQFFYAGRELEGYRRLWKDGGERPSKVWRRCIYVYQSVTERARRAALQTVVAIRPLCGGSRDVARLIGKAVYKTRYTDTEAWNEKVP
jgi:hypothetical protein